MFTKLRENPNLQFLLLALSVALSSLVLGLSAFLSDATDPLSATFTMRYGSEFGIDIASDTYVPDADIIPGSTVAFDPYLTNQGDYDTYVFMEVQLPDKAFALENVGSNWHHIADITDRTVYYYGTQTELSPLESRSLDANEAFVYSDTGPLCTGVTLASNTKLKKGQYTVQAIGYAIQADDLDASSPLGVWQTLSNDLSTS